jgi:peptidyl-prolyl cis-trans isomerase D
MLSKFRHGASSKLLLGFLGLALFAMVITGFGTGGGGMGDIGGLGGGDELASVGGESVTAAEVTDQVNRQLAQARERQPELDIGSFFRGGAFEEILRQMIAQKAMLAFGRDQGVAASKRMVDGEIASIPAFRNFAGQFDEQTFRAALRSENITERQLRDEIAASLIQRQILLPAAGNARVPQGMALQYASLLLEQRSGTVGLVPTQAMATGPAPTEAEVNAFYRDQQSRYIIPERRVLRYALIGREQIAAAAAASEAEIAAYYRSNQAAYGPKQTRTLSQVVLPDQAAARALAARVAGGASFAAAARQAGFSASDIAVGDQSREQFANMSSPAVANAAFEAAEGAVTQPVQSPLGWHVVRVDSINSEGGRPLESVRGEIAQRLGQRKAEEALGALVARVEEALGDGSSFEEVARAERLTIVESPPVTATGQQPGAAGWTAPPELAPLLKPGFEMAEDEDPVVETVTPGQRFAILDVARVVPAAPPALAQIRDQVRRDLIARRAGERARQLAATIVGRINSGMAPRQAFADAPVDLPELQAVTARRLDIARPDQPVPPPMAMLFSLPTGRAKLLEAPNGAGWFVVHLASRVPGDARGQAALIEATRTQFARILGEEYAQQFGRAVERQLEVERNEDAIARTKRQLQGGTAAQ